MAFALDDRVKETSTTTGTGNVTLSGTSSSFQDFSAIGDSNNTFYVIQHQTADEFEVGIGTYTAAGTTLSRDTVLSSSNADALVSFSAGTKDVFVDQPSSRVVTGPSMTPTKGNLAIGDGTTWQPLTVGSDDQVLTADAAESTGIKWATASGSEWTDAGDYLYPTETADRISIGSSTDPNSVNPNLTPDHVLFAADYINTTTTLGDTYGMTVYLEDAPATNSTNVNHAMYVEIETSGTADHGQQIAYDATVFHGSSGDIDSMDGYNAGLLASGGNVVIAMYSFHATNRVTAGTHPKKYSFYDDTTVTGGTITDNYGVFIETPSISGSGAITNAYALYVQDQNAADTINEALHIEGGHVVIDADLFQHSKTSGITASVTQTQGQGALVSTINEISTCANANDTVTLPAAASGRIVKVINNGAETLQIFPASGDDLGQGVDTATTLGTGLCANFSAYDATNWQHEMASGGGEWTDTGTVLHPADLSGAETVVIGGTTTGNADIILGSTGAATFNEQGADVDFRVEGTGQANALFVQGSDGDVGIGTGTPDAALEINAATASTDALVVQSTDDSSTNHLFVTQNAAGTDYITVRGHKPYILEFRGTGQSVFIGQAAGINDDLTSNFNVYIGHQAGTAATTASRNTGIGRQALFALTTGIENMAIGDFALGAVTSGGNNCAVGRNALSSITTNGSCVGIGTSALAAATGANNTAVGHQAGDNITTGANNYILGRNVDAPSATGNNQLVIGNLLFSNGIDGTGTTLSTGNLGVGTNSPDQKLHAEKDTSKTNTVERIARFTHTTSGTPAANIGVGLEFEQETSAGNNEVCGAIDVVTTLTTLGSEDHVMNFPLMAKGTLSTTHHPLSATRYGITVRSTSSADNTVLRIEDQDNSLPDYSAVGFNPSLTTNTIGFAATFSGSLGGVQHAGFSVSGSNTGSPLVFVGYHGGTAPTTATVTFAAYRHNGTTGRTGVSGTMIAHQFITAFGSSPLMTLLGDGSVGVGTASPDQRFHAEKDTSKTSTVERVARFTHTTSGAPAANIGVGLEFEQECTAGNVLIAAIDATATDVGSGTEDGQLTIKTMVAGAAATDVLALSRANGSTLTGVTTPLTVQVTNDSAAEQVMVLKGPDRSPPSSGQDIYLSAELETDTGNAFAEFCRITFQANDIATASKDAEIRFGVQVNNTLTDQMTISQQGIECADDLILSSGVTIRDANINELVSFTQKASATNYLNIANSNGGDVTVEAVGDDTNVQLTLKAKAEEQVALVGGLILNTTSITNTDSPYTVVGDDYIVLADSTSGNITVNLPAAINESGRVLVIKNEGTSNTVTVDGNASETIDNSTTSVLNTLDSITIVCDGTEWHII